MVLTLAMMYMLSVTLSDTEANLWGFFGHRMINRLAVFALPPEMYPFFRAHIQDLSELSVRPDQRRYAVSWEAQRHYVDFEAYEDVLQQWQNSSSYTDSISSEYRAEHGDLPRQVIIHKKMLTRAMYEGNGAEVIRLSAELGHYIADAHVPLHTTRNYDGQLTEQDGIHGLWESRLPELHFESYDLYPDKAIYLDDPYEAIWKVLCESHLLVDSVLSIERSLSVKFSSRIMSHDIRGHVNTKQFSREYAAAYEKRLNGMVARRMRSSAMVIASFWYTCWVDAGMPAMNSGRLESLPDSIISPEVQNIQVTHRSQIHG